jgi:hypothetical protein
MNIFGISLIVLAVLAGAFIIWRQLVENRQEKTEGVDIEAGANDPELNGVVVTTCGVEYPGSRQYEGGTAVVRYDASGAGGKGRVSKWIMARKGPYLRLRGHDVLYEYFREDGSLASDRLVSPEAGLGGGIYSKERVRYFEPDLNGGRVLVRSIYLRADGTTGLISDERTGLFQHYRLDGKSLHSEYFSTVGVGQRSVFYRLDGKTVWMEKDEAENARVYFDLDGNPCDLRFKRERAIGGFSMGPESEPVLFGYDKYQRVGLDGALSPDYDQTWFMRWDKALESTVETLGEVVVYDAFGKKRCEYRLALQPAGEPRFIQEVQHFNADGSTLTRRYRAPGCRSIEVTVGPGVNEFDYRQFGDSDIFAEDADDILFQGFIRNVHGTYDDESHDI